MICTALWRGRWRISREGPRGNAEDPCTEEARLAAAPAEAADTAAGRGGRRRRGASPDGAGGRRRIGGLGGRYTLRGRIVPGPPVSPSHK